MNDELLEMFIEEDCDQHAKSVLLASIGAKTGTDGKEDFTFNRFNVRLNFGDSEAIIDDDLNPDEGEYRLPLANFAKRVQAVGTS
jgi:hypothetical protein